MNGASPMCARAMLTVIRRLSAVCLMLLTGYVVSVDFSCILIQLIGTDSPFLTKGGAVCAGMAVMLFVAWRLLPALWGGRASSYRQAMRKLVAVCTCAIALFPVLHVLLAILGAAQDDKLSNRFIMFHTFW
jgi:multisubunit Na+/H+ antiporter MnhB subunit